MVQQVISANQFDSPYSVYHDEITKSWKILNLKHPSIAVLLASGDNPDVSDDSPAMKILSDGEFIALIKKATELEYLVNATLPFEVINTAKVSQKEVDELKNTNAILTKNLVELKDKLANAEERAKLSESFRLKEKSMDAILKLAGMHDIK